ncbi:hypothetical protein JCM11641_002089 [Rhodosporidiobolus odoratus]
MPPAYPSSSSSAVSPRLPSSSFTSTANNLRKRTTPLLESSELPPQLPSGDDESVFELDFSSIRPVNASPDPGKSPTFSIAESLYPTIRFVKGVEVGDGAKEGVREEVGAEEGGGEGMERVDTGTTVRPAPYRSGSGGGNVGLRRAPSGRVEVGGPRPAAYTSTAMNSTSTSISYYRPPPAPSNSSSTYPVSPLPAVPFLPPAQSLRHSSTVHRPLPAQPAAVPLGRTLSSTSSFSTSSSQTSSTNTHPALSGLPGSVLALASSAAKVIMELEKTLSNQSFESEASSSSSSGATVTPAFVSPPPVSVAPQRPAPAPTRAPPPSGVAQRPLSRPRPVSSLTSRNSCSSSSTSTLRPHSQPPPLPSQRAPPPPLLSSNPPLSLHPHHILPPVPSSVPLSRYGTHGVAGSLPIPEKGYTLDPLPPGRGGGGGAGMDMEERVVSAPGRIEAGKMRIKAEREVPPVPAALRAGRLPVPSYEQEVATFPRRPLVLSEHLALATHVVGRGFGLEGGTGLGRGGGGVRPPTASSQRSSGSGLTRAGSVRSAGSRRKPLPSPVYDQPPLPPPPAAAQPRPATTASTSTLTVTSQQGTGETVITEAFGLSRHKNREERLAKRAAEEKERGEEKWTLAKWGLVGSSVCVRSPSRLAFPVSGWGILTPEDDFGSQVFSCSLAGLICALATYNKAWEGAEVALLVEAGEFGWLLATSVLLLPISLLGLSGALLNSRPLLAWHTFLLWPLLAFLLISSYTPYRRFHQNLEGKLDEAWSRAFSPLQRNLVQEVLGCCGYYNAWHDAAYSAVCYPRTPLPGCKGVLLEFERRMLLRIYRSVFVVVGVHVINMTVGLLASNHVDRQFGRRLLPPAYRLTQTDVHPTLLLQAPAMQQRSSSYASHSSSSSSSYLSHQSPPLGKPTLKQLHLASYRLSRAPSSRSTQSSGSTYSTDSSRTGMSKSRSRMGELPKTPGLSGLGVEVEGEPEVEGWRETPVLGYDDGRRRGYRGDQRGYEREVYEEEEEEEEMKGGIRMVG